MALALKSLEINMGISLQPYKYIIHKSDYYSFITDSGAEYICYFSPYGMYFKNYPELSPKIFDFNLELKNKTTKIFGTDKRIADTVITIVGEFLNSKVNAVVYVCDPTDGKGYLRARKFKTWFNYYEHSSHQILQLNGDINAGGITLYTGLLVHKKNKFRSQFIEAYLDLIDYDDNVK